MWNSSSNEQLKVDKDKGEDVMMAALGRPVLDE